ncbi:MAG: hypothetical protein WKF30_14000 [Pyrinomonadaceae bacterium]
MIGRYCWSPITVRFDMYVVSATLFHRTRWPKIIFPFAVVFYESPAGMLVNFVMGWWSMYPPIFMTPERKRLINSAAALNRFVPSRRRTLIGFHPEGTRTKRRSVFVLRPSPASEG